MDFAMVREVLARVKWEDISDSTLFDIQNGFPEGIRLSEELGLVFRYSVEKAFEDAGGDSERLLNELTRVLSIHFVTAVVWGMQLSQRGA